MVAQGRGILKFEEENYLDLDQASCCTCLKPNTQPRSLGSVAAPDLAQMLTHTLTHAHTHARTHTHSVSKLLYLVS